MLIAYFSRTGTMREVASQVHQHVGGDIKTLHPYPEASRATTDWAKREQETYFRPEITTEDENMDSYDTVILGNR